MQRSDDHASLLPLFDAVAQAPDDDGPRQVLADALLERGDPRGEFISLQLLRARGLSTPMQESRERTLQENHWRRWFLEVPGLGVGPTTAITSLHEFHRGFLLTCVLSPTGVGVDSPAWRMIERVDVAPAPEWQDQRSTRRDPRELAAPALRRLAVITGLDADCLSVVLAGPVRPRLHELGFVGPWLESDRGRREQKQVLALTRFESLRVLKLAPSPFRHHADWLRWLFEAPLLRQLERLTLWMELPFDVAGIQALLMQQRLERMTLELAHTGVQLKFIENRLTVRVDDEFWLRRHAAALRNLAPHFAPFPYQRFDLQVGERRATPRELEKLGEVFVTCAR